MISLSDLIYGGSKGHDDEVSEGTLVSELDVGNTSSSTKLTAKQEERLTTKERDDEAELLLQKYYDDPGDPMSIDELIKGESGTSSSKRHRHAHDDEETKPDAKRTKVVTPQRESSELLFDYRRNGSDREFFSTGRIRDRTGDRGSYRRLFPKRKRQFDEDRNVWDWVLDETEEETRTRKRLQMEKKAQTTRKWRKEWWNFRYEVDVGNAIKYTICSARKPEAQRRRREIRRLELEKAQKEKTTDQLKEEHEHIQLGSLWKRARNMEKDPVKTEYGDPKENPSHPLHYIWQGHCVPKYDKRTNYKSLVQTSTKKNKKFQRRTFETRAQASVFDRVANFDSEMHDNWITNALFPPPTRDQSIYYIAPWLHFHGPRGEGEREEECGYKLQHPPLSIYRTLRKNFMEGRHSAQISWDEFHAKSRIIKAIVARVIVGCGNSDVLTNTPRGTVEKLLDQLPKTHSSADRQSIITAQSRDVANNWILWTEIKHKMDELYEWGRLSLEDYNIIRGELVSSNSECFTDPWSMRSRADFRRRNDGRRALIFNDIEQKYKALLCNRNGGVSANSNDDVAEEKLWSGSYSSTKTRSPTRKELKDLERGLKYANVRHNSPIDLGSIHLTLSTMIGLIASRRDHVSGEKDSRWTIHNEINDFLSSLSRNIWCQGLNGSAAFESFFRHHPNAPLAYVSLMRQSYIANSGLVGLVASDNMKKEDDNLIPNNDAQRDPNDEESKNGSSLDYQQIANELVQCGQMFARDGKLKIFDDIHLTTGIATLARLLPTYAAEFLSRPCFAGGNFEDTPFDLVRMALEEVNRCGDLIYTNNGGGYGSRRAEVGALITEFEKAVDIFQYVISQSPKNLDFHFWLVAARIGSVLIASGIDIGKGARAACPHAYSLEMEPTAENRARHERYDELRASASKAFQGLLLLNKKSVNMGHRYHLAIKSLLEWKEAVNLMAMRPHLDETKYYSIRRLHASHTISWASQECSDDSFSALLSLAQIGIVSKPTLLSQLAMMIERNPNNYENWFTLASALSPLKSIGRIRKQRQKASWWANESGSVKWWDRCYFRFPPSVLPAVQLKPDQISHQFLLVRTAIFDALKEVRPKNHGSRLVWSSMKRKVKYDLKDTNWLWPTEASELDEEDHLELQKDVDITSLVSLGMDVIKSDDKLPDPCAHHYGRQFNIVDTLLEELESPYTVIVSKALVAYHMYGSIDYVEKTVKMLVSKIALVNSDRGANTIVINEKCDEFKLLKWLTNMGLDTLTIMDKYSRQLKREISRSSKRRCTQRHAPFGRKYKFASL